MHFHDLRHAGNHYTASAGAHLRELMERMGHPTSRAAMIYLHSTDPGSELWPMLSIRLPVTSRARSASGRPRSRTKLRTAAHLARKWHATVSKTYEDHQFAPEPGLICTGT
jgi:hypothetical protein